MLMTNLVWWWIILDVLLTEVWSFFSIFFELYEGIFSANQANMNFY